jgi:hypothetical protein
MNTTRNVRITLRGRLTPRLAAAFEGMTLETAPRRSILSGELADQAQLHGLLTRIRDLGLELESVTTSGPPLEGEHPETSGGAA